MSWIDDMVQKVKENMTNGVYSPEAESYNNTVQDWQPQENTGNENTNNDENNDITTNPEGYGNTVENWQVTENIPNPVENVVDDVVNTVKDRLTNGVEQPDEGYSDSFAQEKLPQQDDLLTFADNYMKNKGDQEGFHQTAMDAGLTEKHKDLLTFADDYMKRKNAPKDLESISKGVMGAVDYLKEPAAAALDAISNLSRPQGALVELKGYNDGKFNDANAWEALKKGWNNKTSFESLIDENYRKEHPYISKGVGLAGDVVIDPLWLLPPVKIAQLIGKAAKATGVTDKLAPIGEKIAQSELGQKVTSTVEDVLGINNPLDTANEAYNATKASLSAEAKDALKYTEDIFKKELPGVDRQESEAIIQRLVESYPDIGKFARSGDEVAARDATIEALNNEIDKAKGKLAIAKENVSKVGTLTDDERQIADILSNNNINPNKLEGVVNTAKNMGEIATKPIKMAQPIDNNVRIKKAAADLILAGKFPENDIPKLSGMFTKNELSMLMPDLEKQYKNSAALDEIKQGMTRQGDIVVNPTSKLEQQGINMVNKTGEMSLNKNPNIINSTSNLAGGNTKIIGLADVSPKTQEYINSLRSAGIDVNRYIEDIEKDINDVVHGQYELLNKSGQQGVEQGHVIYDLWGDVVGRAGRISKNPQWYRDFYRENGHAPTKKEMQELAIKQLKEGYEWEGIHVPPHEGLKANTEMLQATKEARRGMPEAAEWYSHGVNPVSKTKTSSLNNPKVNLNGNIDANLKPVNITAKLPNLVDEVVNKVQSVLPKVSIANKPLSTIKLDNLTEDGRRLLVGIKNVPELATKIRTEKELQEQLKAVYRAKEALQKADITPEKTTQVIDSAIKAGYSPKEVEGMFKISERMRDVNQLFTNEAAKRIMISREDAAGFSGGRHLRRMYTALENPEEHYNNLLKTGNKELADKFWESYSKLEGGFKSKGISLNMATFEARKNLPKVVQDQLGRLYEATYPFAKGNKIAAEQFAKYDFLKEVSNKFGSDTMQKGFRKVPITQDGKYGQLEGKFLPERVYKNVLFSVSKHDQEVNTFQKWVQKWKAFRLINPASMNRNFMSGAVMANVFGQVPIYKMPKVVRDTFVDMKHGTARWLEARNNGLFEANISKGDVNSIANKVKGNGTGFTDKLDDVLQKGMEIYSVPDNFWRMAVYNNSRDAGKTAQESVRLASRALFDYSNAPRWIDSLSRNGIVPFAKFPFFAAKETVRAAWERPAALSKWQKPMNGQNDEDQQKLMPDYMKGKSLLPLWNSTKTVNGKQIPVKNNLDLSYILPFANDFSFGNPLVDALTLARTGKNSLGMDVIKPGMTDQDKVRAYAKFYFDAFGPAITSSYNAGKLYDAYKGNVDAKGRQYDLPSATFQVLGGLKNVPVNVDEMYNQQVTHLKSTLQQTAAERTKVKKDASIPQAQKNEKLREYDSQRKEIQLQLYGMGQAYRSIKNKGSQ